MEVGQALMRQDGNMHPMFKAGGGRCLGDQRQDVDASWGTRGTMWTLPDSSWPDEDSWHKMILPGL